MGWSHSAPLALCPMQVTQGAELQERAREVEALRVGELTVRMCYARAKFI